MTDDAAIAIRGRREYADGLAKRHLGQRLLGAHAEWLLALRRIDVGKSNLLLLTVNDHGQGVAVGNLDDAPFERGGQCGGERHP